MKHTEKSKQKMRDAKLRNPTRFWLGRVRDESTKKKISSSLVGTTAWNKGKTGWMSEEGKKNIVHKSGRDHYNWKGGISSNNSRIRSSGRYVNWRRRVFERDHFTCVSCEQVGGALEAHHIMPFSKYPQIRFDVNNGITLCSVCHSNTESYKGRGNRR